MDLAVEITTEFECQTKISEAQSLIASGNYSEASTLLGFYSKDMIVAILSHC